MLSVKSLVITLATGAAVIAVGSPATAATASAPTNPTMAYQFADGLGGGQKVAFAEDGVPMRSTVNLRILVKEFAANYGGVALPVKVTGITDANKDARDDDGKVNVSLFGSSACLSLGSSAYRVVPAACLAPASVPNSVRASAKGVDAAMRWNVASENAWAAQGWGAKAHPYRVDLLRASLSEVRTGVKVTGLVDKNRNGIDDDGKVKFTGKSGSVCLKLSKTTGTAGTATAC